MSRFLPRTRVLFASIAVSIVTAALMLPGVASAASPFKSVAANSAGAGKVKFTGGLDVPKQCRAGRTIRIYAANLATVYQNLPSLGSMTTGKTGNWSKTIGFRTHNVLVLEPKRVGRKTCGGGAFLVELGGPT